MIWVIIIIICIIVIYVFSKFRYDSQNVQIRNISLGGMKKLFPEFVTYFEKNGFEFVEDSGTNLVYKKNLTNNQKSNKFLFLAIESKFMNIMYGYIITKDGSKVKSANVPFSKNYKLEDVEIIIRMITDEFHVLGHLTELPKIVESPVKAEKDLTELYNSLNGLIENADQKGNSDMNPRDKLIYALVEKEKEVEKRKHLELIELYTKQIEDNSQNKIAYYERGNVKMLLEDNIGAFSDFSKALKIDPNYFDAIEGQKSAIEEEKLKRLVDALRTEDDNENKVETVTDIDGYIYEVLEIGNQFWMIDNLRVSRYRNGDLIPVEHDNENWDNLKIGACCNYENNHEYYEEYGKLYNWYAVDDNRGLAPEGWHIPSNEEWQILIDYLGGNEIAGGKLKEAGSKHWGIENKDATNESDFCAIPGGDRSFHGSFTHIGSHGYWWSSSEVTSGSAKCKIIGYCYNNISDFCLNKSAGLSIRCIKDSY